MNPVASRTRPHHRSLVDDDTPAWMSLLGVIATLAALTVVGWAVAG